MLTGLLSRIDERLKELGLSEAAAATKAGLSNSTIRNLRRAARAGKTNVSMTTRSIAALAPVLQTTEGWLMTGMDGESSMQTIPIVSWVAAGRLDRDQAQQAPAIGEFRTVPPRAGDWFALRVEGASMNKISPPESVILVNRRETNLVANACYVIADQDGNATYKRWRPGPPPRFEPVTYEDGYEPVFYDNEPQIIGRVRRSIIDM